MRKTPVVITACVVAITLLLFYLSGTNRIASHFDAQYNFTRLNWEGSDTAQVVYHYWKQSRVRTMEVKILIAIDYGFMLVYCFAVCFILAELLRATRDNKIRALIRLGFIAIAAGTLVDAVQDARILAMMNTHHALVPDFRWMTVSKFTLIAIALLIILIALIAKINISKCRAFIAGYKTWLHAIRLLLSQVLKSLWLFFPGILFLLLVIFCFWTRGQGKDIIIAFKENRARAFFGDSFYWNYTRLVFFAAIGFWAYVTWYSARVIAYMKKAKQEEPIIEIEKDKKIVIAKVGRTYPEISDAFFDEIPRMLGSACFIILEIAVLQSPLFDLPLSQGISMLLLLELLVLNYIVNRWVNRNICEKKWFRTFFFAVLGLFLLCLLLSCMRKNIYFMVILALLLLLHLVYILYNNLHHRDMQVLSASRKYDARSREKISGRIMHFFCVDNAEYRYYVWFLRIGILGIGLYLFAINYLWFARRIGPFPFVILAFGVLLAFGNIVTAFSVKYKINFHLLLFVLAMVIAFRENHGVRITSWGEKTALGPLMPAERPYLKTYLTQWLNEHDRDDGKNIDMYFVMSNGGASRSGYWTAAVLGKIEDATLHTGGKRFSKNVFCLSGTSGGGVGVASFFASLQAKDTMRPLYTASLHKLLKQDYFTQSFARLLGPDFFYYVAAIFKANDRAAILEQSFEKSAADQDTLLAVPLDRMFTQFPAMVGGKINLPILCINTTRVQDGNPGVVSNLVIDSLTFNRRVDVVKLLKDTGDISMASAAILGARFPYISPAGNIKDNDFVDGGYFDNSGAGVVQELIHGIINIGKQDSSPGKKLAAQIARIRYHVLHITNSPDPVDRIHFDPVPPLKNDLFAPILTILGAYDMQTTVNDNRLTNYITDLDTLHADYARISLYKSPSEWSSDKLTFANINEPEYSMNWFMSDTLVNRIDLRLYNNDSLSHYIDKLKK